MEPTTQSSNKIQLLIMAVLVLVLITLVGGYIYYGMRLASTETVTELPLETAPALSDEDETARRLQVLDELMKESPSSLTVEEREAAIDSLVTESEAPTQTEEERIKILDALQNTETAMTEPDSIEPAVE